MTDQELQQLARGYAAKLAEDANLPNCLKNETLEMNQAYLLDFLRWLTKTHCIVSRDFIKQQRKVIEFDKKLMLENPTGERMVLAGVNQAKLELINKLFSESTFEN